MEEQVIQQEKRDSEAPMTEGKVREILEYTLRGVENKPLKNDVINYVLIQFNEDSLQAVLDYRTYEVTIKNAMDGLFCIVYFTHYNEDLVLRDTVYNATFNLMMLLYSRVLNGKHYSLLMQREISRQQHIIAR